MFSKADIILLNKMDIISSTNFDMDIFYKQVRELNRDADIMEVSATKGTNIDKLIKHIEHGIQHKKGLHHGHHSH
jgi:hydrogenase nickel incorporation protein HypB